MKTRATLIALFAIFALSALFALGAQASRPLPIVKRNQPPLLLACGERAILYTQNHAWSAGNATFTVNFDARGGGRVDLSVPPVSGTTRVTNDSTFRPYSIQVTARPDGINPAPVQVYAANEAQQCTGNMEINNIVVTQGPPSAPDASTK